MEVAEASNLQEVSNMQVDVSNSGRQNMEGGAAASGDGSQMATMPQPNELQSQQQSQQPRIAQNAETTALRAMLLEETITQQSQHLDGRECVYCRELGDADDLISPCPHPGGCTGDNQWVHRQCLDRWRSSGRGAQCFTHCPTCKQPYVLEAEEVPVQPADRKARRRLLSQAVKHFLLGVLIVQAFLTALAILIRFIDQDEKLVEIFPFFHPRDVEGMESGSFWDAVRFHKSTYYFAALLAALAMLGFGVVFTWCTKQCCNGGRTAREPAVAYANYQCCEMCCASCCNDCCETCYYTECRCAANPCEDCCGNCGGHCDCDCCPDGEGAGCKECLMMGAIIAIIALILVGVVFVFMWLVTWIQSLVQKYFQVQELRVMTGEYKVKDRKHLHPRGRPGQQSPPPMQAMPDLEANRPEAPGQIYDAMYQDLQAVYGHDAAPRPASPYARGSGESGITRAITRGRFF